MYRNVYTTIKHLKKPRAKTGGLCWVVFARIQDVLQWPELDPSSKLAYTSIQLKPGATWYQMKIEDKDRFFSETDKESDAGPYWEQQVSGYFGGTNAAHILTFGILAHEKIVVMFKDREGSIRFLGNKDAGATITSTYNSGDNNTSRKRAFVCSWQHTQEAPIYIGSLENIADEVIEPPFANEGDFNKDFSDDFKIL